VPSEKRKVYTVGPEREIKALSEISTLAQENKPGNRTFEEILTRLGEVIDYRSASLYLYSRKTGKLEEACTVGRKVDLIGFVNFEMGNGISAWVAKHKRPVLLSNLRKSKGGTHTKSFLSVPIISLGEIKGVINLAHDEPDSYKKSDTDVVAIAASIIALLAERIAYGEFLAEKELEIDNLKNKIGTAETHGFSKGGPDGPDSDSSVLGWKIANSLAIISGNAQFLSMTMKNSGSSVMKRLKAIDKEAANIIAVTRGAIPPSHGAGNSAGHAIRLPSSVPIERKPVSTSK